MKKLLTILLCVMLTVCCSACFSLPGGSGGSSGTSKTQEVTLGDTFTFDGLEITFGAVYGFSTIDNEFSAHNGKEAIRIPIALKNTTGETKSLNIFYYKFFGPSGNELDIVGTLFDDDISYAGEMRSGATMESFVYLLYDGDGDYYAEFDNFSSKVEVKMPLAKP